MVSIHKLDTQADFLNAFNLWHKQVYRYFYLRVNLQTALAEDLTQEVFIKVWESRTKFDWQKSQLRTWIFRISHNLLVDHYRKQQAESLSEVELPVGTDGREDELKQDMSRYLIAKLRQLSDKDRELLTLRYIEELEINEIVIVTGYNYISVKVGIHRALTRLKKLTDG